MLNRRLWILFLAFFIGFVALGARLAKLQLADAGEWRTQLQKFLHHQYVIETYRGRILDRNGLELARDVPSDELAIDYRAMNLDDTWLTKKATDRMIAAGQWTRTGDLQARNRRRDEVKDEIAQQIENIPDAIAAALAPTEGLPPELLREAVLDRYSKIRERIHVIRQDRWSHKYTRDAHQVSSTGAVDTEPDDSALDALFRQMKLEDEVASHMLWPNIPAAAALYFKQHAADFPGLTVRDNAAHNRREYPFGESTAHLIGTLRSVESSVYKGHVFDMPNLLVENDTGDLTGYLPGDRMGDTGVETTAEESLRGWRGVGLVDLADEEDAGHKQTKRIEPVPGKDVQLTIDAALQRDLFDALTSPGKGLLKGEDKKEHPVALVILSVNDAQLLSAISYPSFDPGTLDTVRNQLNKDYRTPLVNRALSGAYQPGSTVKPLLAAAALSEHLVTADETITCMGHFYPSRPDIFRCDLLSGHGPIAMVDALAESCNVYFYTIGQRMGIERLSRWYGNYGFGQDSGLELPEAKGTIPAAIQPDAERARYDSLFLGIGQGPIAVTPLQMANAYATLLRGGVLIPPHIFAPQSQQMQPFQISAGTLATVRRGMEKVVTEGTAKEHFRNFHLVIAGKTGTAEKERPVFDDNGRPVDDPARPLKNPDGSPRLKPDGTPAFKQLVERHDDAWFVAYAPADHPKFIVAAVMEWGGFGGAHAAPMVREALLQLESHNYLPHVDVP